MTRLSIGWRLTLWYLAIFALGQFAFGAGMWLVLRHHLVSLVDKNLQNQAADVPGFLVAQKKNADLPKFREEVTETYAEEHAGEYLAIYTSNGEPVYVSRLSKKEFFRAASFVFRQWFRRPNDSFENRVVVGGIFAFLQSSTNTHGLTFLIATGAPMKEVRETLGALRNYLLLLAPLVLLISAIGGLLAKSPRAGPRRRPDPHRAQYQRPQSQQPTGETGYRRRTAASLRHLERYARPY